MLIVSPCMHRAGGGCLPGRSAQGVCSGGGGCLLQGVSALGESAPSGRCLLWGGVGGVSGGGIPACTEADPSCGQNS